MGTTTAVSAPRRTGAETRKAAQDVALELFTTQGYEATSLRQIADVLGINKASLYYHFKSKEDIVRSLFQARGDETEELLAWISAQPATSDLVERAVLRWVDSFSVEKLRGIRFLGSNPLLTRRLGAADGDRIGVNLTQFVSALAGLLPHPNASNLLLLRMAILSINAAVEAAADSHTPDQDILTAARSAARALVRQTSSQP